MSNHSDFNRGPGHRGMTAPKPPYCEAQRLVDP
jgi:hypothetical protein